MQTYSALLMLRPIISVIIRTMAVVIIKMIFLPLALPLATVEGEAASLQVHYHQHSGFLSLLPYRSLTDHGKG